MNKSDMIRELSRKHGLPFMTVKKIVDDLFATIMSEVLSGNTVSVSGFGNFYLKELKPRRSVDVTNATARITPRRRYPSFAPSVGFKKSARNLRTSVKKGGDSDESLA